MSDVGGATPAPVTPEPTVGEQIDAAVEAVRTELNAKIDTLQTTVDQLSDKVDAAQGQSQSQ